MQEKTIFYLTFFILEKDYIVKQTSKIIIIIKKIYMIF